MSTNVAGDRRLAVIAGESRHRLLALPLFALILLAAGAAPVAADTALSPQRVVTKLADGVYEIRHQDPFPGYVNGNTTVVIGTRDVLVVDSCNTPAAAEEDIAQIRQWTDKPVRYLVNTHWHQDHNLGNAQYLAAFPGLAILAHGETKAMLDATSPHFVAEQSRSLEEAKRSAETDLRGGKGPDGKPMSDRRRHFLQEQVDAAPGMLEQVHRFVYQPPTLTFADELTLDLGGREALVSHPGRGNTGGDVIVYLPQDKILVAGDLVVHPVPYLFDGYPSEWAHTLDALMAFDAAVVVPGHGEILRDDKYLLELRDLLRAVVAQVETQVRTSPEAELDAVKKKVDVTALATELLGDDKDDRGFLDYAIDSLIGLAYHEAKLR